MGTRTKNQKGFGVLAAVLILVIVGIIGGAGFYIMKVNKNVENTNAVTTQNSGTTLTKKLVPAKTVPTKTAPDPTADWQTIKNPDGNWTSIKAPKSWLTQICDNGVYIGLATSKSGLGICNSGATSELGLTYSANKDAGKPLTKASDDKTFTDEMITVNSIDGHKYKSVKDTNTMFAGFTFITYTFVKDNKVLTAIYTQSDSGIDDSALIEQIVHTWIF
jgi:hypothetical protein